MRLDLLRSEVIPHDVEVLKQCLELGDNSLCDEIYLFLEFCSRLAQVTEVSDRLVYGNRNLSQLVKSLNSEH